jgi:hypothetical protein
MLRAGAAEFAYKRPAYKQAPEPQPSTSWEPPAKRPRTVEPTVDAGEFPCLKKFLN